MDPDWLRWVKRLQAVAQDGLTYAWDDHDLTRYGQVREIAAEILAAHSTGNLDKARDLLKLEAGPATPKVDVRPAVFREDEILLIKEPADGTWSVPGDWADVGKTAAEGAARETFEESGYRVRPQRLISAYDRDRHTNVPVPYHVYKLVFLCERLEEETSQPADAPKVRFFGEDELPDLSLTRITPAQIHRFFEHLRHRSLPADFD